MCFVAGIPYRSAPVLPQKLNLQETASRLSRLGDGEVESNPYLISFKEGPYRMVIFAELTGH